jgi:hypothetical protein
MIRLRYAAFTAVLMLGVSQALAQTATSPAASPDASGGGQTLCPANQPNCQPGTGGTKGQMGIQSQGSQSGTSGSLGTQQKLQGGTNGSTAGDTSGSGTSTKKKIYSNSTNGGSSGMSNETTGSVKSGTTGTVSGGTSGGTSSGTSGTASGSTSGSTSGTASNSSSSTNITISSSQQTKVKQVIMQASPPKVTENIQVSVGAVVPQTVSSDMEACPADLIQIAPGLSVIRSDCKYFVLPDGEIVFVDANTMKVVYVIS